MEPMNYQSSSPKYYPRFEEKYYQGLHLYTHWQDCCPAAQPFLLPPPPYPTAPLRSSIPSTATAADPVAKKALNKDLDIGSRVVSARSALLREIREKEEQEPSETKQRIHMALDCNNFDAPERDNKRKRHASRALRTGSTVSNSLEAPKWRPDICGMMPNLYAKTANIGSNNPVRRRQEMRRIVQSDIPDSTVNAQKLSVRVPPYVPDPPSWQQPPPTPRITRLPTPDLPDISDRNFCTASCDLQKESAYSKRSMDKFEMQCKPS